MAEICCGVVGEDESSCDASSRTARKRRMELRRVRTGSDVPSLTAETEGSDVKRRLLDVDPRKCDVAVAYIGSTFTAESENEEKMELVSLPNLGPISDVVLINVRPKFGMTSVCGRRRDMEDSVAIHPAFFPMNQIGDPNPNTTPQLLHYFGVYDGHGCSHVATKCGERLHELVKEELGFEDNVELERCSDDWWKNAMERSFSRMDMEVNPKSSDNGLDRASANCRCELKTPECDIVGSTAVVAVVTPHKIIVANCGDSRAVLSRSGNPVPLSNDHKPDRPDELNRIEAAGGRVIFWEGARVLGVLAMSRAIGDNYLKPYVICEPEVTIMDRAEEDECLILASDGLWDVVSNDTACGVARMCLRCKVVVPPGIECGGVGDGGTASDKACVDASMLLTKLALARGSTDNISVMVIDVRKSK